MGHYTNLTLGEAQEIIKIYSLGKVETITPLSLGNLKLKLQNYSPQKRPKQAVSP